jgi:thioredoxin-dependent peroxiredoxin
MSMSKLLLVSAMCVAVAGVASAQTPAPAPAAAAVPAVQLKVGDKAPEFSLPGTDGKTHKLSDYAGKHVVLAWYPAAFTGGCTAECKSFRDSGTTIKAYDVAYFMASVDTPEKNLAFAKQEEANFPMLSDPEKKVAAAYGVLGARGTASRWTFYIGPDGRIVHIDKAVNVNTAGQDLAAKLAELKVLRK